MEEPVGKQQLLLDFLQQSFQPSLDVPPFLKWLIPLIPPYHLLPLALEFPQILGLSSLRLLLLGQKLAQPHQNEALHLREYVS